VPATKAAVLATWFFISFLPFPIWNLQPSWSSL
jgi:hypothetical protein